MPLYEYRCTSCNRLTEALQRFDDPPLAVCPHCGGELKKLLSAPAFQLKGSGWYKTDYAAKPRGGKGSSPAADAKGGETSPGTESSAAPAKSDSPPAATAESKPAAPKASE